MNAQAVAFAFADKLSRAGLMTDEDTELLCSIERRNGSRNRWSKQEDRKLLRLRTFAPLHQVAVEMGRSHEAVRQRLKKLRRKERQRG
jgi:hypothetical protein